MMSPSFFVYLVMLGPSSRLCGSLNVVWVRDPTDIGIVFLFFLYIIFFLNT